MSLPLFEAEQTLKLFVNTAYWGRDPSSAAAASQLFGSPFSNNLGLLAGASGPSNPGSSTPERFPSGHGHSSTMATAASQAASLAGLHSASKCFVFVVPLKV